MKNINLHQWLWRWHFIAGIISVPFVIMLSITGGIYLFKDDVEHPILDQLSYHEVNATEQHLSLQDQYKIAADYIDKPLTEVIINPSESANTEFVTGRFGDKMSVFVNPVNGEVEGSFSPKDTWMYKVRKLHGELLGGSVGTKVIELIASWMVVLILTGFYIWFPFRKGNYRGVFTVRFNQGKRILYRDLHAVTGFWVSILLILTLAGGLPWTDVFGAQFKKLQKLTGTGYPPSWHGVGLYSEVNDEPLSLDEMLDVAEQQHLKGTVKVGLPKNNKSSFFVSNETFPLSDQKMIHFDQYSGEIIHSHNWSDVGILMRGRMWVMAFHQGQLGGWNWWLIFSFAVLMTIMSTSALLSYLTRKRKGRWEIPQAPPHFMVDKILVGIILLLGVTLPLFGLSIVLIFIGGMVVGRNKSRAQ